MMLSYYASLQFYLLLKVYEINMAVKYHFVRQTDEVLHNLFL